MNAQNKTKSAFVTIIGRPNVGKSTLLNTLLGEKIAIVSNKPQTTRTRITGVLTKGLNQYVFIDTPGLHKPKNLLGEYMMKAVGSAMTDNDVTLFVIEVDAHLNIAEKAALEKLSAIGGKTILIINKVDIVNKVKVAESISAISKLYNFHSIIPISALNKDGIDIIFDELEPLLQESPHFFPEDMLTDIPEKQLVAEIIREKILRLLDEEIPHGIAVNIEEFKETKKLLSIRAEIYCEKESHKRIIIGKNGDMLKKIGTYAREDAEKFFDIKIFLDLWVKVKENWRDRRTLLSDFGFKDEK
ncbi:MAG: GTPase Era [Clostridiales bacterium GWF2_38_85]|nr:MAG: GTPase Era [Clostridiales bacterium GWF2_38_85]HBL84077.1 GTPase Era [Clostridiales bacterium]